MTDRICLPCSVSCDSSCFLLIDKNVRTNIAHDPGPVINYIKRLLIYYVNNFKAFLEPHNTNPYYDLNYELKMTSLVLFHKNIVQCQSPSL